MPALKVKPGRDFPSMNAIHCIRGSWDVANRNQSLPLTRATYIPIGTVPANSMLTAVSLHISTGALAAGATVDVSCGESAPVDPLLVAMTLDAAGNFPVTNTAGLGYSTTRRRVYARLNSAADLTAGAWSVLVQFYPKQD